MCRFRLMMHEDRSGRWDGGEGDARQDQVGDAVDDFSLAYFVPNVTDEFEFPARRNVVVKRVEFSEGRDDATTTTVCAIALIELDGAEIPSDVRIRFSRECETWKNVRTVEDEDADGKKEQSLANDMFVTMFDGSVSFAIAMIAVRRSVRSVAIRLSHVCDRAFPMMWIATDEDSGDAFAVSGISKTTKTFGCIRDCESTVVCVLGKSARRENSPTRCRYSLVRIGEFFREMTPTTLFGPIKYIR